MATSRPAPMSDARRGRPRPQETLERDAQILKILRGRKTGLSREALVEQLGIKSTLVYLSLSRLAAEGSIERVPAVQGRRDQQLWTAVR